MGGWGKNMQRHEKLELLQHFCVVLAFVNQGLFTPQESQSCRRLKRKIFHLLVGKTRHRKNKISIQLSFSSFSTAFPNARCALRFVYELQFLPLTAAILAQHAIFLVLPSSHFPPTLQPIQAEVHADH